MAAGAGFEKLPNNMYYLKSGNTYYGPYSHKPTLLQKREGGEIIHYRLDLATQNYIKQ